MYRSFGAPMAPVQRTFYNGTSESFLDSSTGKAVKLGFTGLAMFSLGRRFVAVMNPNATPGSMVVGGLVLSAMTIGIMDRVSDQGKMA